MSKEYWIEQPFTGVVKVLVKAENEEEAIGKLYEQSVFDLVDQKSKDKDVYFEEIEWDYTDKIISGNVFHGIQNERFIEEEKD
jgi:hypothetical protein